mgnify:CR=1 FL=1
MVDAKSVIRRVTDPEDTNALGVVDRASQKIKTRLAQSLAAEPGEWSTRIKDVVAAYNSTPHATVYGEPQDVRKDPVQAYLVLDDNACEGFG